MNRWPNLLAPVAAFTIGLLNTTGIPSLMVLSVLAPVLGGVQPTRARAGLTVAAYCAACLWPSFFVVRNYAGALNGLVLGPLICLAGCCLLASPFWALWSHDRWRAAWMMPVAILVSAIPPLGIIALGNPLMISGVLFPASRWLGVVLTLALPTALLIRLRLTLIGAVLTSAFLHLRPADSLRPPQGWTGVNTMNTCAVGTIECDFNSFAAVRRQAEALTAGVLVFPEAAVRDWNDATDLFWQQTNDVLRRHSAIVLIGATLRQNGIARNVVLVRGTETNTFVQRVPVPIGMWRPFGNDFPLNLPGPATTVVREHRVAVLICYEQLVPWTWITAMAESADLIVAVSNDVWSRGTPLRRYRSAVTRSWSELFTIPLVSATTQ